MIRQRNVGRINPVLIVYLVSAAASVGPLTQTIYTPILPDLQSEFQTTQLLINLTISIFPMMLAVMQVVYGPLADTRGRRKILLPGIALYVAASIGCAFADSISIFLFFRAIQAVGIGVGSVVASTVIADLFTGAPRGRAMALFQMMMAMGSVIGPVIGGFLGARTGYNGLFLLLAATALMILVGSALFVPETKPETATAVKIGWSDFVRILSHPRASAIILLAFIQYFGYNCFIVFLPLITRQHYGLSPEQTGLVLLPASLGLLLGSFGGGWIQEKWEPRRVLVVTAFASAAALALFAALATLSMASLLVACSLYGISLGLSLPVQISLLAGEFHHDRGTAIGVYNFVRYLGMMSGPLLGTVLYQWGEIPLLFGMASITFALIVWYAGRQLFRPIQS